MEKISVIIPAYNAERFLAEAVESVLAQTVPVFEIIIVDDGSKDNTAEIIKKYVKSAAIKYIYQPNKGAAAARNRGIEESTGNYIAFLDSDDLWLPDKLEKEMKLSQGSDYGMVYCDMSHVVNGKMTHRSYLKEQNYRFAGTGDVFHGLLQENFIFTPTVIVKRTVISSIGGFDESYRICEDYKAWLSIARRYSVGFLDEPLVIRRRFDANITTDKFLYSFSSVRLFKELLKYEDDITAKKIIRTELDKRSFDLGYWYWKKNDFLKAVPYLTTGYFARRPRSWQG